MTAVVGILNKQGVAIAADSAVTITGTNGKKILNKANKVFTLSKYHPVGVMVYNSATFMMTPWETIIKVYRKQLKDKFFSTLKEYQNDFIDFLRSKSFFTNTDEEKLLLFNFIQTVINTVRNEVINQNKILHDNPTDDNKNQLLQLIENRTDEYINQFTASPNFCDDFADYPFDEFEAFIADFFSIVIETSYTNLGYTISNELENKLKHLAHVFLKTKESLTNYTGLIFTGFGEDEIYPSLIPVDISFSIGNRLRYYIEENRAATISTANNGAICPFAQTDVIDTILRGIDPSLDNIYLNNFNSLFNRYNQEILNLIGGTNPILTAQIQALDIQTVVNEYSKMNEQIKRENYISPLMNAVSSLAKEDLAEMAESLIYLTYLKRRITFAEESVGGPVDVAIISKGDGFIWIKRKHYFDPKLNQHFFDNYFNN
ncbi:hypothetical protein [Parafilimonas terrae]|uniref:Uncharacterized protein n=1 Tax=Parafilimonas terrae TaxID=1465490 RepID=A0A1I5ZIG9_9BACT|nr:hypothetical protein [Parafilimonas terrae]SFQ56282.1 hypothetical protein SAMN05444277_1351 [Parafilimonas terrae]